MLGHVKTWDTNDANKSVTATRGSGGRKWKLTEKLGHAKAWDTTDANALRTVDLVELGESPGELYFGMLNPKT